MRQDQTCDSADSVLRSRHMSGRGTFAGHVCAGRSRATAFSEWLASSEAAGRRSHTSAIATSGSKALLRPWLTTLGNSSAVDPGSHTALMCSRDATGAVFSNEYCVVRCALCCPFRHRLYKAFCWTRNQMRQVALAATSHPVRWGRWRRAPPSWWRDAEAQRAAGRISKWIGLPP